MLEIKRESGIEDRLEEARDKSSVSPTIPNELYLFLEEFEHYRDHWIHTNELGHIQTPPSLDFFLDPASIETFTRVAKDIAGDWHLTITSTLLGELIRNSFSRGHNNFTIHVDDEPSLLTNMQGEKDRLLQVTVHGDFGYAWGCRSQYLDLAIQGEYSAVSICQEEMAPHHIKNSTIRIAQEVEFMNLGNSNNCTFYVREITCKYTKLMGNNLTLITSDKDSFEKLDCLEKQGVELQYKQW